MHLYDVHEENPNQAYEIQFRFVSPEEGRLYRLASQLQKRGYELEFSFVNSRSHWNCVAARSFVPTAESLNRLCLEMLNLAERYQVVFDSWETGSS